MQETTLAALRAMRTSLRQRWEAVLRMQPVSSPLASPDSLVYLMDWTLDQIFESLRNGTARRRTRSGIKLQSFAEPVEKCVCGMNPLLAYFAAAEKTLIEAVFALASPLPAMTPGEREACVNEILVALRFVARTEIESFCAVCQRGRGCQPVAAEVGTKALS